MRLTDKSAGGLSYAVMCIAERRNQALALLAWVDIDAAREFWKSPAAGALIQEWDANAPPEITLLKCCSLRRKIRSNSCAGIRMFLSPIAAVPQLG
jgi:hypothetical protein